MINLFPPYSNLVRFANHNIKHILSQEFWFPFVLRDAFFLLTFYRITFFFLIFSDLKKDLCRTLCPICLGRSISLDKNWHIRVPPQPLIDDVANDINDCYVTFSGFHWQQTYVAAHHQVEVEERSSLPTAQPALACFVSKSSAKQGFYLYSFEAFLVYSE